MENLLQYLNGVLHIDPIIVLIVIASGFFQSKYLAAFTWSKNANTDSAWKTLLVSFLVSALYIFIAFPTFEGSDREIVSKFFLSYFLATSFYELLIKPIVSLIKKATQNDKAI